MPTVDVPTIEIDSFVESESTDADRKFRRWRALLEEAARRGIRSVGSLTLLAEPPPVDREALPARLRRLADRKPTVHSVIWVTRSDDPQIVADLAHIAAGVSHELVWAVPPDAIPIDIAHALGAGVVCAVGALSNRSATDLAVGELRRGLRESREALRQVLGYAPSIYCPDSLDGLVREEAARAGFTMILAPRRLAEDATPKQLCAWIAGGRSPRWHSLRAP